MRKLRQICLITALVLTFTFPVYADEIECPGITAPQAAGDMPNGITDALLLLIASLV